MLIDFREKVRKREKYQSIASCTCLSRGPNLQPKHQTCTLLVYWTSSNQLSHISQGNKEELLTILKKSLKMNCLKNGGFHVTGF